MATVEIDEQSPEQPEPATTGRSQNDGVRSWSRNVKVTVLIGVLFVLTLAFTLAVRFGNDPRRVDSPLIGKPAPTTNLPYLEREGSLSIADLRGNIVVVNFWASWCVACRAEHDDLMWAARTYRDEGVVFVGVDYQDETDDAIAFLDEMGRGYDNVVDPQSRFAIEFGVYGIPETFFIDANGIVAAKITGESNMPILAETLDEMLAGGAPESRTEGTTQTSRDE
jgi:cytochrome c biogenesis protein CcmG/thiol:disulfide interchange protein DsbE